MPILVRRISRAKWDKIDIVRDNDPVADAITSCLRTFNNTLSTWLIENEEQLNEAILALITGPKVEKLDSFQIIYFNEKMLHDLGLKLESTEGDTIIDALKNSHRDISELTYTKIGKVKDVVLDCLKNNRFKSVTKGELKKLLADAISKKQLSFEDLHENIVKELQK